MEATRAARNLQGAYIRPQPLGREEFSCSAQETYRLIPEQLLPCLPVLARCRSTAEVTKHPVYQSIRHTLAEVLGQAQYARAAFVSGFPLSAHFGLERGFQVYDDALPSGAGPVAERKATQTTAAALKWIHANNDPWLVWVHYFDPHDPYVPPPLYRGTGMRGAYNGEVAYVDHAIGLLLKGISQSTSRPQLTVFTSDHGESLGEHGENTHGFFIYQSTLAVPLIFHFPGTIKPGQRNLRARLVDIMPTILDVIGMPKPGDYDGISLMPLFSGASLDIPPAYIETHRPWHSYGWSPLKGILTQHWKLIVSPKPELYDLRHDPQERHNRIRKQRRKATSLRAMLAQRTAPTASSSQPSDAWAAKELLEKLRSLGYVGGGTPSRPSSSNLVDPKDRIGLWNLMGEAESLMSGQRYAEALQKFDRVLADDPDNLFALARSGVALFEIGQTRAALARMDRAVQVNPDHLDARITYAGVLMRANRWRDAAQHWEKIVQLQPRWVQAWVNWGNTLGKGGSPQQAVEAFNQALSIEPENPTLMLRLAFAEYAAGNVANAAVPRKRVAPARRKYPTSGRVLDEGC